MEHSLGLILRLCEWFGVSLGTEHSLGLILRLCEWFGGWNTALVSYSGCADGKAMNSQVLTMLILSTSGSVSMAVAPVDPSESPPAVRCSLDIEERKGRKEWREEEGRDKKEVMETGREGRRTNS